MASDSDGLQTLTVSFWRSSNSVLQRKLPLLIPLLSFVLSDPILGYNTYKYLSMILHTWTNISISSWHFNTLLSSKLKVVMLNTFYSNTGMARLTRFPGQGNLEMSSLSGTHTKTPQKSQFWSLLSQKRCANFTNN